MTTTFMPDNWWKVCSSMLNNLANGISRGYCLLLLSFVYSMTYSESFSIGLIFRFNCVYLVDAYASPSIPKLSLVIFSYNFVNTWTSLWSFIFYFIIISKYSSLYIFLTSFFASSIFPFDIKYFGVSFL